MFALVESSRTRTLQGGWAGRTGSFLVHATALTAAVLLTRHPAAPPPEPRIVEGVFLPPSPARRPQLPGTGGVALPTRPVFQLPTTPALPAPNVPSNALPAPGLFADPGTVTTPNAPPGPPGGGWLLPKDPDAVDELPVLLSHPEIRYPELLRQAGIEGTVVVEVVLDTLGRVEPGSVRVVRASQPRFDEEARAVVAASRYRPARLAGRAVRVRIQVPVAFAIRR